MKRKLASILSDLPNIVQDYEGNLSLKSLQVKYGYAINTLRKYIRLYEKHEGDLEGVKYEAAEKVYFKEDFVDKTDKIGLLELDVMVLLRRVESLESEVRDLRGELSRLRVLRVKCEKSAPAEKAPRRSRRKPKNRRKGK